MKPPAFHPQTRASEYLGSANYAASVVLFCWTPTTRNRMWN